MTNAGLEIELVVETSGDIRLVYNELLKLSNLGEETISRGSHVEPDSAGWWWVDLSPVEGPTLGPYAKRSDAIDAEVGWLHQYWL